MSAPTLAIVTSCYRYGQYLHEWALSIRALTRRPDQAVIWCHGDQPVDANAGVLARALLADVGIPTTLHMNLEQVDFGTARNEAVACADTDWVLHLDADDMLMPHALDDWAALAPAADVVCFGYERCGDLRAGPKNRTKVYQSSQGPSTLASPAPCSGVSPFRRAFWDHAPYATDLIGGWDTALWLGFAHLGARFVATKRPCFWYRQHADSVFNTRRLSGWPAQRAGAELQSRRRGDAGVTVVVPRSRADSPDRLAAWAWLRQRYATHFPEWEVVEGFCDGRWVKGAAIQDALRRATGKTLVLADADCVIEPEALRRAVARVEAGAPWVVPHRRVHRLSPSQTRNWLTLDPSAWEAPPTVDLDRAAYEGFAGGGFVVVNRAAYLATGGIPTIFVGWGAEDETLALILDTMLGKHERLEAPLVHLYHPSQPERPRIMGLANRRLWQRYRQAAGNREAMWHLVQPGRPSVVPVAASEMHTTRAARQQEARARMAAQR